MSASALGAHPDQVDAVALEQVIQALSNCGPYPRLSADLTNQMTLIVRKG